MIKIEGLIIGLTGAFGSGCTFLADEFFCKEHNYSKYSLSDELKLRFEQDNNRKHANRRELQDYGNRLRETEDLSVLADYVIEKIKRETVKNTAKNYIIDSIRNPSEIAAFRKEFQNFILIAVFADYTIRWERVKDTYSESKDSFDSDELKDQGTYEPQHGQHVSKCFFEADIIISNNETINIRSPNVKHKDMSGIISNYLNAFKNPTFSEPIIEESLMAIAYAVGRRSKCFKRKVGAIIVDDKNNILSSGFNGVPKGIEECRDEPGECYRDKRRDELKNKIEQSIVDQGGVDAKIVANDIVKRIKVLELCRALHAEESAIINLVGASKVALFENCTLFATTYPCNLCANKIVQTGIKTVRYFEPYPVEEAKEIFEKAGVLAEPFTGITFRAYFRAFSFLP